MEYDKELQHVVELIGHTEKMPFLYLYDFLKSEKEHEKRKESLREIEVEIS